MYIGQERTLWRVGVGEEHDEACAQFKNLVVALAGSPLNIVVDYSDYAGGDMHIAILDRSGLAVLQEISGCTSQLAGFQMGGLWWIGEGDDPGWLVRQSRPDEWSDFEVRGFRVDDPGTSLTAPMHEYVVAQNGRLLCVRLQPETKEPETKEAEVCIFDPVTFSLSEPIRLFIAEESINEVGMHRTI